MIKRELTFVSGVQESVLVHFISQNFIKSKLVMKNFLTKTNKFRLFLYFFEFLSCY